MAETKLSFSKQKIAGEDPDYKRLKEGGAKNIHTWRLANIAVNGDAETEMDAPDASFLGDVEEVTTIVCPTKVNAIGGEYINLNFSATIGDGSGETKHHFYVDKAEITTITCLAKKNMIGSGSFHFWVDNGAGCQTEYYCWINKAEITTVTFGSTMAEMTDASSFDFEVDDGDGTVTHYYVWFDKTGTTEDPTGTGTGIEADISGATTAAEVAEIVKDLIHAKADVTCTRDGDDIIIVNTNNGEVTDAIESIAGTGCTFSIEQGGDDPSEDGTAIDCDISASTTATDVAEVIDGLIAAKDDVGAANAGAVLTITNANNGNVTDACDGDIATGVTFSIEQGGDNPNRAACCTITCSTKADAVESSTFHFFVADGDGDETEYYIWINKGAGTDPEESGTAIECDISGATTAIEVAEVIDALIAAKDDVGCDNGGTTTLPIINAKAGSVTDPHDGETTATTWGFIFQDGTLDALAVGTAHSCDISGSTTADEVGIVIEGIIDGVAGYTTSEADGTITIESDKTGNITSCNQSGESFTITIVNKGRDYYEGSYLYVVSASANDNDIAAGHVRTVKIIGWDINGDPIEVEVAMAGATYVKLGTRLKAVSHMRAATFGSGGQDAADAIILTTSNTGNGTTLLTIAQHGTESNGARIYVPDGNGLIITLLRLCNVTNANTGSTMIKLYFSGFEHVRNIDPDNDIMVITCGPEGMVELKPINITPRIGTDTAYVLLKDSEISATGNETFFFEMKFFTFKI